MKTRSRARFSYSIDGNVIAIIDQDDGMSVTNDAEAVIADIASVVPDIDRFHVIYRDTELYWDGMVVKNGRFVAFFPIRVRSLADAIWDVQSRRLA